MATEPKPRTRSSSTQRGARSKCTPEMIEAVADRVRNGMGKDAAAVDAGISVASLHNWIGRGRAGEAPYDEFLRRIEAASASVKREIGKVLIKGLRSRNIHVATKVAMWLGERLDPETYGRRQELSGPNGGPVQVAAAVAVEVVTNAQLKGAKPDQLAATISAIYTSLTESDAPAQDVPQRS